ncbi:small-conductance mechanosensitive channel [Algoriphagus iocasae]|uniref:Small-conductance mechanosensitive channel n=1 Tax=Algoriphagus iocasae TaxID=1836499 RepID=A0A841MRC4_9BACT|nr:mechanosensitive ion channel [Algoriphagus iocasae]MBB6328189.1 small-conductance mechanosensitive channel [Algoriphagus iocasae]
MRIAEIFGYDTQNVLEKITEKLESWGEAAVSSLPNLVLAIIIMVVSIFVARNLKKYSNRYLNKIRINPTISRFLSQIIFMGMIVLGIMLSLSALELTRTVSSILAGLGIVGLALGFAFQDTAANFMSGVFITFNQPYKIGDIIQTKDGHEGTVIDINLRVTKIRTYNGPIVHVPNRMLFQEYFINYTDEGRRRIQIECGVSYGEDLETVQKIALEAVENIPSRLKSEDNSIFWTGFGDSSINFTLNVWVKFTNNELNFIPARNEAIIALKKAFDKEGITIPFPIRTLDFGIKGGVTMKEELKELSAMKLDTN